MLEKQKKWCQNQVEKGKKWVNDNKFALGCAAGSIATLGIGMILGKINEPKEGTVIYKREEAFDNNVIGRVLWRNRFGKEYQFMAIDFSDDGEKDLKRICDNLNEIVYPGD